jgi:hypothetical protein
VVLSTPIAAVPPENLLLPPFWSKPNMLYAPSSAQKYSFLLGSFEKAEKLRISKCNLA